MPGFLGCIGNRESSFGQKISNQLINESISTKDLYIERRTVNKFMEDKVFQENKNYVVVVEGFILNSNELILKYNKHTFFETITHMYIKNGNEFFNEFRGSFSGFIYDKEKDVKIIYTNQIGDKQMFYSEHSGKLIFGSEINYLVEYYQNNKLSYTFNESAAYALLTLGFMIEDNTLFTEIKKLTAGHYILVEGSNYSVIQYYKLKNEPNFKQTEDEIIDKIDELFRKAIKRAFDKDLEYGYKHLVGLSGGLDSRMTTWVGNDMGYGENIVNYTFSQSGYLDETIPKKIASDLKHEWIFKALDNGLFLKDIENVVKYTSGNVLYYGLAHNKSFLDLINVESFGILHSGQLGDVVIGTFYSSSFNEKNYNIDDGAYSKILVEKLYNTNLLKKEYENEEIYKFYGRGFNGANQGLLSTQEVMETYSPFYDIDFLEYCLSIPVEIRYNHNIYYKWILKKYPKAADYVWEKTGLKITAWELNLLGRKIPIRKLPSRIYKYLYRKLKPSHSSSATPDHMNPLDYWYETNNDLKTFMNKYYENNISRLKFSKELISDCQELYLNGNSIEKNQVLTLLAFMKLYFERDYYEK